MHCNEKNLGKDIKLYYTDLFLYKYLLEAFFDLGTRRQRLFCLLALGKTRILLMHSVPDFQGQLAEQVCANTGMKAKQQLQEKIGFFFFFLFCPPFFFLERPQTILNLMEETHIQNTG